MNQQCYCKIISGQAKGVYAKLLRLVLRIIAILYSIVVQLRNFLYSKGMFKVHTVDAAVISIGNITTGGTGKTPLVIWLANFLTQSSKLKTKNLCILTRGYKSTQKSKLKTQNYSDEPVILTQNCPNVKVVINPDRIAAAHHAIANFNAEVLIMDDGFQHRRLHRDLDIVTIDATCPFGYDKLLPAGLLREPISALRRAHAVVLTHCDQVSNPQLSQIENTVLEINPNILLAKSIHAPLFAVTPDGSQIDINHLKHKKVFALCGIGNPEAFLKTFQLLNVDVVGSIIHNDHHLYTESCVSQIIHQATTTNANLVLTTQKDWTKIHSLLPPDSKVPFAYLAIQIAFLTGEDQLKRLIEHTIAGRIAQT